MLSDPAQLPAGVQFYLQSQASSPTDAAIFGGTASIGKQVRQQVASAPAG